MSVLITTSLGDIVVDLYTDKCPLTCKNFLKLCKIKYYNGCLFHTVQKDFTAQTGDPTGTGAGGNSVYKFLYGDQARFFGDEIHLDLKHSKRGTVAMASAGENLNASQFYITLRDNLDYLDGKHTKFFAVKLNVRGDILPSLTQGRGAYAPRPHVTGKILGRWVLDWLEVFGEVAEEFDTLTRINEAYVDEKNRPYKNIRIKHTYILDDPFDDPPQLAELIPEASPDGKPKDEVDDEARLEDDWVPLDEQLGSAELEEALRAKVAHSSAVVLESIGDIPDAEIKPPENVLFVCKLNPVTEDEDLHTIFSRFGTVVSADIIRDYKTGDSLCYAFIEFETQEACEQAYFKMDNALIDDRRIHVDFSQSVAKLWSQYRRKANQMGKGKGCFKCGAIDHMAKDCTGGSSTNLPPPKYTLKDDNIQHGGGENSSYEMVFDEVYPGSPRREKRHRSRDPDNHIERQKMHRKSSEDLKYDNREKRDSNDRHKQSERNTGHRGDERHRERSAIQYPEEGIDRERDRGRRKEKDDDRRDVRDYRKRTPESESHGDRRDGASHRKRTEDNGASREWKEERDGRKRYTDDDGLAETGSRGDARKQQRDGRKRHADDDSLEETGSRGNARKQERDGRKRHAEDDSLEETGSRGDARKQERDGRKRHAEDDSLAKTGSRGDARKQERDGRKRHAEDDSLAETGSRGDARKQGRDGGKRHADDDSLAETGDRGDARKRGADGDYKKRTADDSHSGDLGAGRDYKKRHAAIDEDMKGEQGRKEERENRRREIKSDGGHDRRRH